LRALYFCFFGGVGAYIPFFSAYLRGLGFSGEQIGRAQMVGTLAAAPAAMLWATFADRAGALSGALKITLVWSLAALSLLPLVGSPMGMAALLFLNGCANPAIGPLADAVTVETVRGDRAPGSAYTRVRLFGSLGYIVVAQLLGFALAARGERPGDVVVPLALIVCTASAALIAFTLPAQKVAPRSVAPGTRFGWRADPNMLLLFAAAALHSASTTPYYQLFGVLVRDRGLPSSVTALAMAVGVLAEVIAMLSFSAVERKVSLGSILMLAFAAGSLRWGLVARASSAHEIVALQLLHGLSFGLYWGALVKATARLIPAHLRATGQALFGSLTASLGGAIGYPLAGLAYDRWHGAPSVFAAASFVELVPLGLAVTLRLRRL